jgi:hypothetical protein
LLIKDKSELSLRTGALLNQNEAILLTSINTLSEQDIAHTLVLLWKRPNTWSSRFVSWSSGTACRALNSITHSVLVGIDGEFLAIGPDGDVKGKVAEKGIFSSTASIAGNAFVVGMRGLFYRWGGAEIWGRVGPPFPTTVGFQALDGFNEHDMYAVGWKGELWHIREGSGKRLHSSTNLILTGVCCAGNGTVYCCGQQGILLRGREDKWEVIEHDGTREDLWAVHWFKGALYVSSIRFLYRLEGDRLVLVLFGSDIPESCYHLTSASDSVLWSIGSKDVMEYDGSDWERIL